MVLGAVWCPEDRTREIAVRLREIRVRHGLPPWFEMKWEKVSPGQTRFYRDVLDYFLDDDDLHYRALVIARKGLLRHEAFGQDHDTWYYKMQFELLKVLLSPANTYSIYLDVKDTHSATRCSKLREVLCSSMYDFRRSIIRRVQPVRSHEVQQIQLADLLTGIVSYANRGLTTSTAKLELVRRLQQRSHYTLTRSTLLREEKVNIFCWQAQEPQE